MAGFHAIERKGRGGLDPGFFLINDHGVFVDGQSAAEPQKILPVERHGHVEGAPGIQHGEKADTRNRQEDSPPRIWEPKLLVRIAK